MLRTRSLLRRTNEQFLSSLAEEIEAHFLVNDLRPAYQAMRKVTAVRQIISDPVGVLDHWAVYFEQLYQCRDSFDGPSISEDPPSLTEVSGAISKLISGKAVGICGILVDLLKTGDEPMTWGLYAVLAAIWQSGTVLPDLLRDVAIPLWKWKGGRWDCSSHRGITLLSIPGKVVTHIFLRCIRNHLLRHQMPEESRFTPGKSTIDSIIALQVTAERCEFGRGLLAAYIGLKIFDMVHWESLWEFLRLRGFPTRNIGLIIVCILYTGTESAVKCGGGLSSYPFSNEVKLLGLEVSTNTHPPSHVNEQGIRGLASIVTLGGHECRIQENLNCGSLLLKKETEIIKLWKNIVHIFSKIFLVGYLHTYEEDTLRLVKKRMAYI
ncbi:uncharacterized protein [Penaeus vannamei]|uniref:uncharacterized protein n=1 Tax=Penaeus vannamei TaxID=6689 RepID=UPI00387F4135